MAKRKSASNDKAPTKDKMDVEGEDSGSDDDGDLDVDFEFFDPSPEIDFHGLKVLLRQLFDVDNQLFDLSELTNMILAQPLLGSTVKCDGNESDPYAFLTVLNMHQHRSKPVIQQLIQYLTSKTRGQQSSSLKDLPKLLEPSSEAAQVGLILTERFINMPHQTVPSMYNMLLEEIRWANEEKESYQFTHYLIISKTYTEVESKLDAEDDRPQKKSKKVSGATETFYFHPEDEVLQKHAVGSCSFEYSKQGEEGASDAKRAFQEMGIKPQGHLILIGAGKFEGAVKAVHEYLGGAEAA
ncbi:Mss4p nuclear export [Vermiconidia calcicola]|uniref:Mss4p nuclear export n=1 Tax=Vermiconidia calcicola TaxID=1690605 RepID=A0ACC3NE07_9PEZI|nr:Mss4p nuclear export [Vermiconidia calcicola]